MKISDMVTHPFLKQPLFYQSLLFYGKNMNPSFLENSQNSHPTMTRRYNIKTKNPYSTHKVLNH